MTHTIEPAASGRAKCRGCGKPIAKGELRFGERLPNPFADGEMTLWFHLQCAALKRPESLKPTLQESTLDIEDATSLVRSMEFGLEHRRLERINGVEKATSARARCRSCREVISKGQWRIPLVFFEEGMFNASGFVHVTCAAQFFETTDILTYIVHFTDELPPEDLEELQQALDGSGKISP
ncbi:MAG: PARP-type zinc finger-containing protein [Gammaproteobacteria bacterium]|nr:PARP-type zinc finger-containing protein [Gammaproteobacteria bacterium]